MYCPKCGEANPADATYCQKCGADLRAAPMTTARMGGTTSSGDKTGSFKISSVFSDAIALVRNPKGFMEANRDNDVSINTIMINYVAVLAVLPFIGTLIGDLITYRAFGF